MRHVLSTILAIAPLLPACGQATQGTDPTDSGAASVTVTGIGSFGTSDGATTEPTAGTDAPTGGDSDSQGTTTTTTTTPTTGPVDPATTDAATSFPQTSTSLPNTTGFEPPTCDPVGAVEAIRTALVTDPPYGARVTFTGMEQAPGWNAPEFAPWLVDALDAASTATFGEPSRKFGEGGTIPFMGMLGERFPDAQFVITGVIAALQFRATRSLEDVN